MLDVALTWAARRLRRGYPGWARGVPTHTIGGATAYWTIDRITEFWT